MSIIYIALPVSLLIAFGALWAVLWAIRSGQYDDVDTPAIRMLHDDTEIKQNTTSNSQSKSASIKSDPDINHVS